MRAFAFAAAALLSATAPAVADSCYDVYGTGNFSCDEQQPAPKPAPARNLRSDLQKRMAEAKRAAEAQTSRGNKVRDAQALLEGVKAKLVRNVAPEERAALRKEYDSATRDFRNAADAFIAGAPAGERDERRQRRDGFLAEVETLAKAAGLFDLAPAMQQTAAVPDAPRPEWPKKVLCEPKNKSGVERCYEVGRRGLSCTLVLEQNGERMWSQKQPRCSNTFALQLRNDLLRGDELPTFGKLTRASKQAEPVPEAPSVDVGEALDTGISVLGALSGVVGGASALAGASRAGAATSSASSLTHAARSTVGNGGPTRAPAANRSDITGTR